MESLLMITLLSHLTEVMVLFRLLEVKGFPLFFTRSCQQVVKHVVVSGETNVQVTWEAFPTNEDTVFWFYSTNKGKRHRTNDRTVNYVLYPLITCKCLQIAKLSPKVNMFSNVSVLFLIYMYCFYSRTFYS